MSGDTGYDLDETDIDLIETIDADYDVSLNEISETLGLSKSAIHYRLKKLKESGVIEGITADIDPVAFGLVMTAITEVSVRHESGYAANIGEQLATIPGVDQVFYTMGNVDFVVLSRVQNRSQLNALIDAMVEIEGVQETASRFIMREIETGPGSLPELTDGMRENLLENRPTSALSEIE